MRFRVISLFLIILVGTSCEYFNLKKKSQLQEIDTIIDFSSVDVSPIFKSCKDLLEKQAKTTCFRTTIHTQISESLSAQSFIVKKPLNEIIQVHLLIDKKGIVSVKEIVSSESLKVLIPSLDSIIALSLKKLPKLFPASKRGVPITTQYQLPIKITVN